MPQSKVENARMVGNIQEARQKYSPNIETLAATKTLVVESLTLQWLDPGGSARIIILPAEADSKGLVFVLINAADADEALTVNDDGGTLVQVVGENEIGTFYCDGTTWLGSVAHATVAGSVKRADLEADIIDGSKLEDNAVDSEHYTDGSIDLVHMSVNSVDSDQYVDASVDVEHLSVPKNGVVTFVAGFAAFTDVGDATGFIDFDTDIPQGALVHGWKAVVATGFTGDTTAICQVGISGDLNRYSADVAASVLAAATVGSNALAVDAAKGMNAVVTARITVTGGADFTSISGGSMTVSIYYTETQ